LFQNDDAHFEENEAFVDPIGHEIENNWGCCGKIII
jgi:hypothetical protein